MLLFSEMNILSQIQTNPNKAWAGKNKPQPSTRLLFGYSQAALYKNKAPLARNLLDAKQWTSSVIWLIYFSWMNVIFLYCFLWKILQRILQNKPTNLPLSNWKFKLQFPFKFCVIWLKIMMGFKDRSSASIFTLKLKAE